MRRILYERPVTSCLLVECLLNKVSEQPGRLSRITCRRYFGWKHRSRTDFERKGDDVAEFQTPRPSRRKFCMACSGDNSLATFHTSVGPNDCWHGQCSRNR